jgi:RNA polymerase sigma-70 factor, ECF subfamily
MAGRFEEIYRRHLNAVFRFALSCVSKKEIAEEITSDAFLALLRNLDGIDESQLPGWLITVARNRARDYWRRQATERKYLESYCDPPAVESEAGGNWILANPELKPAQRVCLALRYVEGFTRSEIAEKLGFSEMQVKGYLQHGLETVRKALAGKKSNEDQAN